MRYEKAVSLRGLTARIIKDSNRSPYVLVFDAHEHTQEFLQEALVRVGWEADLVSLNSGGALWNKTLTGVTLNQLKLEGEKLLGELYNATRQLFFEQGGLAELEAEEEALQLKAQEGLKA